MNQKTAEASLRLKTKVWNQKKRQSRTIQARFFDAQLPENFLITWMRFSYKASIGNLPEAKRRPRRLKTLMR
jgi:hypothetical protein